MPSGDRTRDQSVYTGRAVPGPRPVPRPGTPATHPLTPLPKKTPQLMYGGMSFVCLCRLSRTRSLDRRRNPLVFFNSEVYKIQPTPRYKNFPYLLPFSSPRLNLLPKDTPGRVVGILPTPYSKAPPPVVAFPDPRPATNQGRPTYVVHPLPHHSLLRSLPHRLPPISCGTDKRQLEVETRGPLGPDPPRRGLDPPRTVRSHLVDDPRHSPQARNTEDVDTPEGLHELGY